MSRSGDHHTPSSPPKAHECSPDRKYARFRIGTAEFAYTTCAGYLKALGQAWAAGLSPEPLPGAMGRDLSSAARALGGVDVDLSERTRPRPA